MRWAKRISYIIFILIIMTTCFIFLKSYERDVTEFKLGLEYKFYEENELQVFYSLGTNDWDELLSLRKTYQKVGEWEKIEFVLPIHIEKLRVDLGSKAETIYLKNITISSNSNVVVDLESLNINNNQIEQIINKQGIYEVSATGEDPYFTFNAMPFIKKAIQGVSLWKTLFYFIVSLVLGVSCHIILKYRQSVLQLVNEAFVNRSMVLSLARNDFKTKYASSYLGVLWGFIQPLLTIVTYWFVFQVGLRSGNVSDVPFILWFISGIVPWFFFSDAFSGGTNSLTEYGYLVKKVVFKVELLPIVKVVSVLFVQFFFIVFIGVTFSVYGYYPSVYNVQILYYLFCNFILAVSLVTLTSGIVLFFKDLNQIIVIVLQIGFWFTPIGWPITMLNDFWSVIFKLNPMFYIVQGYRDTFIDHVLFYERPIDTLYFWFFCLITLSAGVVIFRKLKPHFADVL